MEEGDADVGLCTAVLMACRIGLGDWGCWILSGVLGFVGLGWVAGDVGFRTAVLGICGIGRGSWLYMGIFWGLGAWGHRWMALRRSSVVGVLLIHFLFLKYHGDAHDDEFRG